MFQDCVSQIRPLFKGLGLVGWSDNNLYGVWWRVGRSKQASKATVRHAWWLTTAAEIENVWKHLSDLFSNNIPSVEAETQDQNIDLCYESLALKLQILHWARRWWRRRREHAENTHTHRAIHTGPVCTTILHPPPPQVKHRANVNITGWLMCGLASWLGWIYKFFFFFNCRAANWLTHARVRSHAPSLHTCLFSTFRLVFPRCKSCNSALMCHMQRHCASYSLIDPYSAITC